MKINTEKFGELEIEEDRIFNFVLPIIGFNELSKFIIIDLNKDNIFKWLQSIEDPNLAFPIVSLYNLNMDYTINLPDNVAEILKIKNVENLLVMNIASIPRENPNETTVNMLAPIIFNLEEQLASQVILSGSGYDISFPLFKKD